MYKYKYMNINLHNWVVGIRRGITNVVHIN